ncbi:MAG: hypothetical protein AB7W59_00200 [Acidimicrobiia bacterium]
MPNQAKQRFISLDVAEVSVVDTPANEVEFLVHKRMEDSIMGDTNTSATAPAAVEKQNQPEVVQQPATTENSQEAVEKALAQVTALVEGIAKAAGATIVDPEEARDAEVEKAKKGMGAMRKTYREQLKANGVKGDAMKAALAAFDKCAMMESEAAKEQKAQKGAEAAPALTEEQQATAIAQKALDELSQSITKGKMFTKERQDKMKAAMEQLKAVMEEMSTVPTGASPATSTPDTTTFGTSGVQELTKSLTEAIGNLQTQFKEGLAEVTKRIEAVEKARQPGNALPTDDTDKPAPVKKSLWSGIL